MKLYRDFPIPSDRMGMLWALNGIDDACILEFGPAGTTHFAIEGMMQLGIETNTRTFTTHIDDHDVTFGSEERLIKALIEIDKKEQPEYIFTFGSSITSIIGIDLESIQLQMNNELNAKIIIFPNCDFQSDFKVGAEITNEILVKQISKSEHKRVIANSYNIIGLGLYQYNCYSDLEEIKRMMLDHFGYELNCAFTIQSSIDEIKKAKNAKINLVINEEGLKAAKWMLEHFGQPYVNLKPIGINHTRQWLQEIGDNIEQSYKGDKLDDLEHMINQLKRRVNHIQNKKVFIDEEIYDQTNFKLFLCDMGFEISSRIDDSRLVFSNGLEAKRNQNCIQIVHPSYKNQSNYPYTPFVGERGVHYLIQMVNNTLSKTE